jgi:hypothetical protein
MPTRDEMNSCGVPFLALRRPEVIEVDASAAGLESELGIRDAALVWATGRIAELEAALLRADQTNTRILEVNATLMSEAEDLRDETLRLSIDTSVLNTLLEEQRRIAKRIARETPASFPAPRQADDL